MSKRQSQELLKELRFCVIDLETTGGNHESDQIIEIGMARIENLEIVDEKNFLIDPEMKIPEFIQKLTSIRQKDIKGCPKIEEVVDDILDFIGEDIIVAHNISFDLPFLNSVLRRLGKEELKNKNLCTNVMTKHMIPEITSSNLGYMSQLFGIEHSKAHRAHDDALATAKLLLKYLEIFIEKGISKVNQLYYPRNKFELDRIHFSPSADRSKILEIILENDNPMLITLKGDKGVILGALPAHAPPKEIEFITDFISKNKWKRLTLRLLNPFLEGLLHFNNHLLKFEGDNKESLVKYLGQRYANAQKTCEQKVENLDFVLAPHLVKEQVIVYSFLNLNPNSKAIFKLPAQKKKMMNYLHSQIKRFEQNHNGKRIQAVNKDVIPLIEAELSHKSSQHPYLFLSRKQIKESERSTLKLIDSFMQEDKTSYNFPLQHL